MRRLILILGILYVILNISCNEKKIENLQNNSIVFDLKDIRERGKLVAITQNNSTDYFVYKGEPMGFQFEMLKELAVYLNIDLEIIVSNDIDEMFDKLQKGECDIIAINLTKTKERNKIIGFTLPLMQTRQVLVQRKPDNWYNMSYEKIEKSVIRNTLNLAQKTIFVQKNSSFKARLLNLSDEIGDSIYIEEKDDLETEQLITMVANNEIDYCVSDENVAKVNQLYYPNIDIKTPISMSQNISWGVRKNSPELMDYINTWIDEFKKKAKYKNVYAKYFKNQNSVFIKKSEFYSAVTGRVSIYDDIIKLKSSSINWDWKLLASLIYQESKFNNDLKSRFGAYGIMQLMPSTAERFGIDSLASPEENIDAGVKYIKWLNEQLSEIEDSVERNKFVIASYNVGLGHVLDARRLAEKNGKDPNIWKDNVDFYLLNKSNPKYYQDTAVKHGYCRGEEPYRYVSEVLDRYEHYKNVLKE